MLPRTGTPSMFRLLLVLALLAPSPALADVALPAIVSDGMILQQGIRPPIWPRLDHGPASTRGR